MTHDDNGPRDRNAQLSALREDLTATLTKTETGPDILRRHAHLLDDMLVALMGDNATERINGRYISNWIDLVLRLQKQCADTIKTAEAVDYMRFIADRPGPLPRPLFPGNELLRIRFNMPRNWTAEERAKQAAAIKKWKPWTRSTGPKTDEGRAASSQNALKHGFDSADILELKRVLRLQREFLKGFKK